MTDEEFDLWWEFRLAFSDLPHVRIYIRDATNQRRGPAYATGRFLPPPAPPYLVYVYDERMWDDLDLRLHSQPPFPAYLDQADNVTRWFKDFQEWAQESRNQWREDLGIFQRGFFQRPWREGDPRGVEDVFSPIGNALVAKTIWAKDFGRIWGGGRGL